MPHLSPITLLVAAHARGGGGLAVRRPRTRKGRVLPRRNTHTKEATVIHCFTLTIDGHTALARASSPLAPGEVEVIRAAIAIARDRVVAHTPVTRPFASGRRTICRGCGVAWPCHHREEA